MSFSSSVFSYFFGLLTAFLNRKCVCVYFIDFRNEKISARVRVCFNVVCTLLKFIDMYVYARHSFHRFDVDLLAFHQ